MLVMQPYRLVCATRWCTMGGVAQKHCFMHVLAGCGKVPCSGEVVQDLPVVAVEDGLLHEGAATGKAAECWVDSWGQGLCCEARGLATIQHLQAK